MHETSSTDYNATWNGTLLHLDDSSVKIALWKLLADEWFDVICQFAMGERGKKLTSFVLLALLESASTTTSTTVGLSLRSTSELLLRSANFYEALCFKEHALNIILDSFNSFFKTNADKNLVTCYANFEDFGKSANDLVTVMTSSKKIRVKTEILVKAMHYLNQLLLFPLEYYTKNERQKVIWMTFIVDTLAGIATEADDEVRTKAQLRTRTLLLRFFAISNSGNILEMNADLLGWFLTTTSFRPEQENELSKAVMGRTKQLDIQVLRSLISMVISNATKAKEILDHTCKMRLEWVKNNQPNALDWVIDMVETIKESLHRHSSKEEVVNNISAQESITELSRFAIQALNDAKTRISTTLENEKEDETSSITPIDSSLLILVLLLQEYAQYLGSRGDQVVDIGALSRVMVALASPCTILLQRSLRSSSVSDRTSIMKMTTAFVSALCKILSRYQHVYVTERVFAVIWFIYSLVYESDELCAHNLCHAFFSWIGDLDSEQFAVVTQGFIEQSNRLITQATEKDRKVYLSLLSEMLRGATDEQKLWLRRYLPTFITKLSTMSRQAETVGFIQQAIQFLTTITAQQSLRTSAYDISLILACLIQVANPPEIERFGQVSKETAHILFHSICDVLQNLLLYHRQQLIDIMAPFIATLQALFYCFRSPHLALVTKKRKVDETTTGQKKFALISTWAPLDVSAADRCARIFSSMTKKSSIGGGGKSSSTTVNGKRYTGLQQYRIISRHAPFVLIEYFTIQSNVTMSISQPQVKTILETGLYNLMDMTSENDRNMVLAGLDASGKLLFKNFYTSWKENHMYTGQ
ncbi:Urb2/Npa2 family-domain-containing protein [Phascolomyces articulosus]|uniref:Urb2/Npa2 family-domain-containing protein n=1 Tax=Phascolomyces articulosus TaxID=60185 RepID=A0AAD5P8H1_9FUNG|nr:Urb2/Npa2 family-domain-containing protein [Phascolomyces articulosus]